MRVQFHVRHLVLRRGDSVFPQIHPILAQEANKNNVLALMEIGGEHAWVVSVTH